MNNKFWIPIVIFIVFVIFIISLVFSKKLDVISHNMRKNKNNAEFEKYDTTIKGSDLVSLINRAYSKNMKLNKHRQDVDESVKPYYSDGEKTIMIEVEISEETIPMKSIVDNGYDKFFEHLYEDDFECIKKTYHKNGNIAYMLFKLKTGMIN